MRYGNLGNALDWAAHWRQHGGFVQMTPLVGTIACFQPGSDGADAVFGHVAVVIGVGGGKDFTISEMNGPKGPGRTDDRVCFDGPGVSFLREFIPQPPSPPGEDVPPMYQRTNGSTYLLVGSSLLTLGSPADIQYNLSLGSKLMLEKDMTPEYAASFNKLPVV